MLALALALTLHAGGPANLLVWGGGKTPALAQASLDDWKQRSGAWSSWINLASGYPRVVKSDDVQGLNPGFHIVVLGACSDAEVTMRLDLLKLLEPSVYQKAVTWPEAPACPQLGTKDVPWEDVSPIVRTKVAGGELSALTISRGRDQVWASEVLVRFQPKSGDPVFENYEHADCDGGNFAPRAGGLAVEVECVTGRCTTWGTSLIRYTYTVKDGQVSESTKVAKVISKAVCD
ncbi:MAG: hypothetical protein U0228_34400 [Myxococcaceae bacterium]